MRRYSEDDGFGFLGQIAAIALGVFIGVLGALMAWESITAWRMEQAARVAAQKMQQSIQQMRQDDQRRQLELERLKNASRDEAAEKQASLFAAEQRQRELIARKEAAWQQFYRPSAACLHDSANILCANAYMAAKKGLMRSTGNEPLVVGCVLKAVASPKHKRGEINSSRRQFII